MTAISFADGQGMSGLYFTGILWLTAIGMSDSIGVCPLLLLLPAFEAWKFES